MDLKEFITETLVQIQEGVQDAIKRRSETPGANGVINPIFEAIEEHGPGHRQSVEFDVAVTATEAASGEGKAGLKVWSVEIDGEGRKSSEHSTVSRIKFSIPLVPPTVLVQAPKS